MPLLILLFIVVPIAELYVIIQVGGAIGVLPTIALLLADSIFGAMLMRAQGRRTWRRFTEAVQAGRAPARETLDGALVLLGGAFLLTPGFLTDVIGVALLLPPTRALVRRLLARRFLGRMTVSMTGAGAFPRSRSRSGAGDDDYDVEGTATDVEPKPKTPPRLGGPQAQ
jgi:UPF0716 protein FxsA